MAEISTKERILAAARKLFVAHGFAGTSMAKIAQLAHVNHSLIFHHFRNKEDLWAAVKQDIVQDANRQNRTLPDTDLPFNDFLKELFARNMAFYRNNPDIINMLNWQRLEYKNESAIGVTLSNDMQAWIQAFAVYQQKGDINQTLKPEFIITLILAIISSAAMDPNIFISKEHAQKAYINFCVDQLLKALKS